MMMMMMMMMLLSIAQSSLSARADPGTHGGCFDQQEKHFLKQTLGRENLSGVVGERHVGCLPRDSVSIFQSRLLTNRWRMYAHSYAAAQQQQQQQRRPQRSVTLSTHPKVWICCVPSDAHRLLAVVQGRILLLLLLLLSITSLLLLLLPFLLLLVGGGGGDVVVASKCQCFVSRLLSIGCKERMLLVAFGDSVACWTIHNERHNTTINTRINNSTIKRINKQSTTINNNIQTIKTTMKQTINNNKYNSKQQ